MKVEELAAILEPLSVLGDTGSEVVSLAYDSRRVEPGAVFFALVGEAKDGHAFIDQAVERGAAAVVGQADLAEPATTYLRVADSRLALALAAHEFFDRPTEKLKLIGVTGTSGKTTTSYALESILTAAGIETGVIGTVNYRFAGKTLPAPVTTPQSLDLVEMLAEMVDRGVEAAVMEVSSHALVQRRVDGCVFAAAAFTNLSRDHLDYHRDMESYFEAKRRLFTDFDLAGRALIGLDDPYGRRLKAELGEAALTFGLSPEADFRAEAVRMNGTGLQANIITPSGRFELTSPLLGRINLLNLLTAAGLAWIIGLDDETIARGLRAVGGVPGRMEDVGRPYGRRVIVDYSHKVEALEKALDTVRRLTPGRVITVFGCGGDRDKGKRPMMAKAAAGNSDVIIVTSDNPRSEDPLAIIEDIVAGFDEETIGFFEPRPEAVPGRGVSYTTVEDRRAAIRLAVEIAGDDDTVIICGKGHENYQIVGDKRLHLDDREEALQALESLAKGGWR